MIDPHSTYLQAVLPRRDSSYGQAILAKLAQKYDVDTRVIWSELPGWFLEVVLHGDDELLKVTT